MPGLCTRDLFATDLLIGPYGSAATLVAAAEAERARRVMVNGAGPAAVIHGRAPRYVFQTAIPYSAYGPVVLPVAAEAGYRRLFVVHATTWPRTRWRRPLSGRRERTSASRWRCTDRARSTLALRSRKRARAAPRLGGLRRRARGRRDGEDLQANELRARAFLRARQRIRATSRCSVRTRNGASAQSTSTRASASAVAFAKAFAAKWTVPAGLVAAQGYTAGVVLGAAVRQVGTLDPGSCAGRWRNSKFQRRSAPTRSRRKTARRSAPRRRWCRSARAASTRATAPALPAME